MAASLRLDPPRNRVRQGILLGTLGALTGFLISSWVNYNYGDAEVAMLFWFLMGTALYTDYTNSSSV